MRNIKVKPDAFCDSIIDSRGIERRMYLFDISDHENVALIVVCEGIGSIRLTREPLTVIDMISNGFDILNAAIIIRRINEWFGTFPQPNLIQLRDQAEEVEKQNRPIEG